MTADFENALKRAWTGTSCFPICRAWDGDGAYCGGHAALLEMVDGVHIPRCQCPPRIPSGLPDSFKPDVLCVKERRRLRAVVGVEEESK